jgi:putative FmdB family regulatory protein
MIYDYECQKCGVVDEYQHKLNTKIQEKCKHCAAGPEDLKKILSPLKATHSSWGTWKR